MKIYHFIVRLGEMSGLTTMVFVAGVLLTPLLCAGSINFVTIETLPPGEQYRQLSLVLMVAAGADPALVDSLLHESSQKEADQDSSFDPDVYKTPLTRIVDQQTMLSGAARLLRFANRSQKEIRAKLSAIEVANPVLISMLDGQAVSEDAIIIRNAIADSISYAGLEAKTLAHLLEAYRTRTLRLRNEMEFASFSAELDRITAESIRAVGGQSDAYQRMFDDEVVAKGFKRQIETADYIYKRDKAFDKHAAEMTEEIIKNVVESQSEVNH